MAALTDLINQVEDKTLRTRLLQEAALLNKQKKFGLVFEEHIPECTPLNGISIKRGSTVAKKSGLVNEIYRVTKIDDEVACCLRVSSGDTEEVALSELVLVAQFGEPIYPALQQLDAVENAPDSDLWHALIEADNYHALQLLEYLYPKKVDCIYIDPPYNTGARDWKYNNDYVDSSDAWRHSKWLSMIQKRLKIAGRVLNPENSVLIVTIDEKEYLHLGCLLEEMFPEARIQMISSIINHAGVSRGEEFSRSNEYIYFVKFGKAAPTPIALSDEWRGNMKSKKKDKLVWNQLMRAGTNARRIDRPNLFYPLFISEDGNRIVDIGKSIDISINRNSIPPLPGTRIIWPVRPNGEEGNWQIEPSRLFSIYQKGYVRLGRFTNQSMALTYLKSGEQKKVENGVFSIIGRRKDGSIIEGDMEEERTFIPGTQWDIQSHNATYFGSQLLNKVLGENRFTFPKSLYAVQDAIRFFVANKPNALIIDFFAGSGTTLHAVNLINAEDNGHRRCILITNNEVSADEAKSLLVQGYQPGDPEWEKLGIAQYVTWPRTICSIKGHDINNNPLNGKYIGSDHPMSEGFSANCEYFKLGFLDKNEVALGRQFKEILPLLWLKAGSVGKRPELGNEILDMLILPQNKMAVLINEVSYLEFEEKLEKHPEIDTVFIVTDSDRAYREMISGIKVKNTFQLYRDYLDNFRINARRQGR